MNISLFVDVHVVCVCAVVDCGDLPDPADGAVTHASTTFQSIAVYNCDIGFTLDRQAIRTCQASGSWSGEAPTCGQELG